MKAPDKIYIRPMQNPSDGYVGIAWRDKHGEMTEYIRKDALLEWAKEELSKASVSSDSIGRRNAFIDVVDKLNSM